MAYTSPTRWSSGWNARPLPRRLQVRARQEPSVSDAARKRSRVFLPSRPPTRPSKPAWPAKWPLRSDGTSSPEVRKHMPALPCSALPCRLFSLEDGLRTLAQPTPRGRVPARILIWKQEAGARVLKIALRRANLGFGHILPPLWVGVYSKRRGRAAASAIHVGCNYES